MGTILLWFTKRWKTFNIHQQRWFVKKQHNFFGILERFHLHNMKLFCQNTIEKNFSSLIWIEYQFPDFNSVNSLMQRSKLKKKTYYDCSILQRELLWLKNSIERLKQNKLCIWWKLDFKLKLKIVLNIDKLTTTKRSHAIDDVYPSTKHNKFNNSSVFSYDNR